MTLPSDAWIEKTALQAIADEVSEARNSLPVPPLVDLEASLATSLWQKAIRRGHVEWAIAAALGIQRRDPDYVMRRIRVIALEEVSVANLALVAQTLAIAGKRTLHAKLGAQAVLVHLTTQLALSAKCRIPCDMASWLEPIDRKLQPMGTPTRTQAFLGGDLERIRDAAESWRYLAPESMRVQGRWVTIGQSDPERRDEFLEYVDAPPVLRFVVRKGSGTYALNALSVPAYQLATIHSDVRTMHASALASDECIGGIPAYAYCMYSGPGRQALRLLLQQDGWPFDDVVPAKDRVGVLGHLLFYVEGGFCRERFEIAHGASIEAASEMTLLGRYGVPADHVAPLKKGMDDRIPRLNVIRRRVIGGA